MIALALTVGVFATWFVLGLAFTTFAGDALPRSLRLRIAPAIGIGVSAVLTITLNRLGLPVGAFAVPLATVAVCGSSALLIARRDGIPRPEALAFGLPPLVVLAFVGYPLVKYGFEWVSFGNDDMTNYCLSAQRFITSGYFQTPSLSLATENRELNQLFWGFYALRGERAGAEEMLALVAAIAHVPPLRSFMSCITAGYLAMVSAAGALTDLRSRGGWRPSVSTVLSGLAPLSAFGVFDQLLGQIFGLAALSLVAAVWLRPLEASTVPGRATIVAVRALGISALVAVYPELVPVALAGITLFAVLAYSRTRRLPYRRSDAIAGALGVLLLGTYSIAMFRLVVARVHSVRSEGGAIASDLFPTYLLPSGIPTLWGLQPISGAPSDLLQSAYIAFGLLATTLALIALCRVVWRKSTPAAFIVAPMVLLAAVTRTNGYSLYKLAMYVQPFLMPVLLDGAATPRTVKRRISNLAAVAASIAVAAACWIPTQMAYLLASIDYANGASFSEVRNASSEHILSRLDTISREAGRAVISDTANISLAKIEAGSLRSQSLDFKSQYYVYFSLLDDGRSTRDPASAEFVQAYRSWFSTDHFGEAFPLCRPKTTRCTARFSLSRSWSPDEPNHLLLGSAGRFSVLNRATTSSKPVVFLAPYEKVSDHLIQLNTNIGGAPSPSTPREAVSLFQPEPDHYYPDSTMAALGRYLVFSLERPSRRVRMIVDLTESMQHDGRNELPRSATVVSGQAVSLGAIGRGSARLLSESFTPVVRDGTALVGLDFGTDGSYFPEERNGLMRLFGTSVRRDSRRVIGFARDISAVDADAVEPAPRMISKFPEDLANRGLFYSGLYEDGFASDASRLGLAANGERALHLRGQIPLIGDPQFRTRLTVSIDGRTAAAYDLGVGDFDETIAGPFPRATYSIELHFSQSQRIPDPDDRIVGCALKSVGFEP